MLQKHYQNTGLEFNAARQKMADIPMDATLIDNHLVRHPGSFENVHALPGVPSILQAMFEGLSARLQGGVVITVQCATGEGSIATILADVQAAHDAHLSVATPVQTGQFWHGCRHQRA